MNFKFKILFFLVLAGFTYLIYKTKYSSVNKISSVFSTDTKDVNSKPIEFKGNEIDKNSFQSQSDLDGAVGVKSTSSLKESIDLDLVKKNVGNKSLDTLIMEQKHSDEVVFSFNVFKKNRLNLSRLVDELTELNKVSYLKSEKSQEYQSLYNQKQEKIYKQYEIYLRSQDDLRKSLEKELESFISSHQI